MPRTRLSQHGVRDAGTSAHWQPLKAITLSTSAEFSPRVRGVKHICQRHFQRIFWTTDVEHNCRLKAELVLEITELYLRLPAETRQNGGGR